MLRSFSRNKDGTLNQDITLRILAPGSINELELEFLLLFDILNRGFDKGDSCNLDRLPHEGGGDTRPNHRGSH